MKASGLLLIALGVAAVYYFEQLGVAGGTTNIIFQGVDIKSLTNFVCNFNIQNVSNAKITLYAMSADVSLNGSNIGNASYFGQPIDIQPRSQQIIGVSFNPNWLNVPADIAALVSNGAAGGLNFKVSGNANINTLVVPFDLGTQLNLGS